MANTGRPTEYEDRMEIRSVMLPDELYEHAKKVGKNASDGVRKCIEEHMKREES